MLTILPRVVVSLSKGHIYYVDYSAHSSLTCCAIRSEHMQAHPSDMPSLFKHKHPPVAVVMIQTDLQPEIDFDRHEKQRSLKDTVCGKSSNPGWPMRILRNPSV